MTFNLLNIGASALYASQRAMEVVGQNVSNAGTDGYTRQRLDTAAGRPSPGTAGVIGDGMRGTGVVVTGISRIRDALSDVAWRSEASAAGSSGAKATVLDRAQQILGPVTGGAPASLDKFWASFDQLSLSPADPAARAGVLNAGAEVAGSLRDASRQLDQITADTVGKVAGDVTTVNGLLHQVADLNKAILNAKASGEAPNDLTDTRDKALDQLATLTGATFQTDSAGQVVVSIGSTPVVSSTDVTELATVTTAGGAPQVTAAGSSAPLPVGGELGGFVAVTATTLPSLRGQLNGLATSLMSAVNAQHAAGYEPGGSHGMAFFTGTDASDITVNPALTPDRVAAAAGTTDPVTGAVTVSAQDAANALVMAQLRTTKVTGTPPVSIGDALHALASRLGAEAAGAEQGKSSAAQSLDGATKQRVAANGVNIDEEMVDLVRWQRTYEAAAKVISTADAMLDRLINNMGAGH